MTIDEQLTYLRKGMAEIIREEDLRERLIEAAKTGRPLRVKAGFDPTAPDLHLGHTVLLRKMKHFQDLGHTVIFLIGDMTGMIGDPTGRNVTRPPMTREAIEQQRRNLQDAGLQDSRSRKNRGPLQQRMAGAAEVRRHRPAVLASTPWRAFWSATISPSATRKARRSRCTSCCTRWRRPTIRWRSKCDVEMGGTDQKFNLLVGREIQRDSGQPPQIVATTPILEGIDGVNKMSKSKGNYIGITEPPEVMFRKVMQISDDLMWRYYELLTDRQPEARDRGACGRSMHPMDAKIALGKIDRHRISTRPPTAEAAAEVFNRVVRRKEVPADMPDRARCPKACAKDGAIRVDKLLAQDRAGRIGERRGAQDQGRRGGNQRREGQGPGAADERPELIIQVGKNWRRVTVSR